MKIYYKAYNNDEFVGIACKIVNDNAKSSAALKGISEESLISIARGDKLEARDKTLEQLIENQREKTFPTKKKGVSPHAGGRKPTHVMVPPKRKEMTPPKPESTK